MDNVFENLFDTYKRNLKKGKSIKIHGRTIYPIIQVMSLEIEDTFIYEDIKPIAIAVIEGNNRYFKSLNEEDEEISEILNKNNLWDELGIL